MGQNGHMVAYKSHFDDSKIFIFVWVVGLVLIIFGLGAAKLSDKQGNQRQQVYHLAFTPGNYWSYRMYQQVGSLVSILTNNIMVKR